MWLDLLIIVGFLVVVIGYAVVWAKYGHRWPWVGWLFVAWCLASIGISSYQSDWLWVSINTIWVFWGAHSTRKDYEEHYQWKAHQHG